MNIHEYQAKAVLSEFGVPISKGVPVLTASDAEGAAKQLPGPIYVVKSQIHAGGRGKGKFKEASAGDKGGVRIAKSTAEVAEYAKQMLGATLVTVQTGAHGKQVNRLYIEDGSDIDKEFYLSLLVNRETSEVSFVVSTEGGVNIEDVAHKAPEKIISFSVEPAPGIASFACSTPKCRSTTTRCSAMPTWRRCATRPRKTPRKSKLRNTAST